VKLKYRTTATTKMQTTVITDVPPGPDSSNHETILQFRPARVHGTTVTFASVLPYLLPFHAKEKRASNGRPL
jgi:hypothetical protein